jgi:DNA-binding NarL/FixJ family response regulator
LRFDTVRKARVLLGDDHAVLLEGLKGILQPDFEVVGAVSDADALLAAARKLRPDVIVLDVSMPRMNGIEAARRLRQSNPEAKLIVLTMHCDAGVAMEAIEAGASAYVLKQSASTELLKAISEVMRGRLYVAAPLAEALRGRADAGPRKTRSRREVLTPRQREVLRLLVEGRGPKDVAMRLGISERTVEFHKYKIMERLGLRSVAELTAYAARHRIIAAAPLAEK